MYCDYDYIIVGSGIAGLYGAYLLSSKSRNRPKILILEKNGKREMGGRMGNVNFHGVRVVTGSGIGRKEKDVLLQELMSDLGIESHPFVVKTQYSPAIPPEHRVDIMEVMTILKREYNVAKKRGEPAVDEMTFEEFAKPLLGNELYKAFVTCTAYTDFEKEDLTETLYHYGMDDNVNGWTGLSINWKKLLTVLHKVLVERGVDFRFHADVCHLERVEYFDILTEKKEAIFYLHTEREEVFKARQVILATTVDSVRKLLPPSQFPLYRQIQGQPFLRLYGKFNKEYANVMRERCFISTVVPGPLHRIIPYDVDKGVYMIAYTDNAGAEYFKRRRLLENTEANRSTICRVIEKALRIPYKGLEMADMRVVYWEIGTHYYEPLSQPQSQQPQSQQHTHAIKREIKTRNHFIRAAQHPMPGLLVVGEMVSRQQGWVEGALESVRVALI